nr:immunoglobulin heavy chain junction region [Mus musculus]MBK4186408.1 immunoglobulin heavy chain junction region [Mus musculus]
EDTGIYYCTE